MTATQILLASEADAITLGQDIAIAMQPGDALLLSGPLGAGKSVLARAVLRQLANDETLEVPSPTYTICQTYDLPISVAHFDFYRIGSRHELDELGLDEALETGTIIVEWPERGVEDQADAAYGASALRVSIEPQEGDRRSVTIKPAGPVENPFWERLLRSLAVRNFLSQGWAARVRRRHLQGDASTRRYETVSHEGIERVLMDAPAQPDGPPVKDGLPYSQIAHLAEDTKPFVAIAQCLQEKGFAAPRIHACDTDQGLLLLEHLGSDTIVQAGKPVKDRYMAAAQLLSVMHAKTWPNPVKLEAAQGEPAKYRVPAYDREAMMIEVGLFADWYAPAHLGKPLDEQHYAAFETLWSKLISVVQQSERTLVLRDYHSPNIIWRGGEEFPANLGLIDFQDAVFGPCAYDLASLAQDARVDISADLESAIVAHYLQYRHMAVDEPSLRRDYAIMAAQRATKILGIFVRLHERDGKDAYLKHLPRIRGYLHRCLHHDALAEYRDWLNAVGCLLAQ